MNYLIFGKYAKRVQEVLSSLDLSFKNDICAFIEEIKTRKNVVLIPYCGRRTQKEQDDLYAIGRNDLGEVIGHTVTNTKNSLHVLGLAIDFFVLDISKQRADWQSPIYLEVFSFLKIHKTLRGLGRDLGHIERRK